MSRAPRRYGYTWFVTNEYDAFGQSYLLKIMSYDPVKDFTPIARTGDLPFMLVINPEIPANSVAELIALAKKDPRQIFICQRQFVGDRLRRHVCPPRRHRSPARALQELAAGFDRRDRRPRLHDVHRCADRAAHVNGKALKALAVTTSGLRRCCRIFRPWTQL